MRLASHRSAEAAFELGEFFARCRHQQNGRGEKRSLDRSGHAIPLSVLVILDGTQSLRPALIGHGVDMVTHAFWERRRRVASPGIGLVARTVAGCHRRDLPSGSTLPR